MEYYAQGFKQQLKRWFAAYYYQTAAPVRAELFKYLSSASPLLLGIEGLP